MHLPANTFSARHESRGELTASSRGTLLTASGTANLKGSWTSLGSASSFAYEGITIYLSRPSAAANFMVDIGIDDGAGNNFVLVSNHYFAAQKAEHNSAVFVPVHVPAGALIEARVACSTASATVDIVVVGHSANPGGFPGYSRAVALFTPSSSRGVTVDPGATADTEGSWAQLTASCPADIDAIFGVVGFNNDTARAAVFAGMLLDIGVGASSSEFDAVPNIAFGWEATWDGPNDVFFGPFACTIAAGTRIAARAQCMINTAGDRSVDLALYGLCK